MSQVVESNCVSPVHLVRKILIIDDEEDIREVAAVALEVVAGWKVTTARSGSEGIAAAQRDLPDAVLLDMQMPGMDGPVTLRAFQATEGLATVPVLFLTARLQAAERRALTGIGAVAVLAKPFNPLTLAKEIAQILGWSLPA